MDITGSPSGANVWAFSPRTLTGLGSSLQPGGTFASLIAAGTTIIIRPPAGVFYLLSIGCLAAVNAQYGFMMSNGVATSLVQLASPGTALFVNAFANNNFCVALTNAGTGVGTYSLNIVELLS